MSVVVAMWTTYADRSLPRKSGEVVAERHRQPVAHRLQGPRAGPVAGYPDR
jgi:hypothetical protein